MELNGSIPDWVLSGYGYGYGSGYGDGDGSGYGSGDGSGYGSGYGYGYGYGDGSGSGYGDGDGSGYGDGYLFHVARTILGERIPQCSVLAFWKSDSQGKACNNGVSQQAAHIGMREVVNGPLEICTKKALHATMNPSKWKGERLWIVALHGDFQQQEDKFAALEREIIAEVKF